MVLWRKSVNRTILKRIFYVLLYGSQQTTMDILTQETRGLFIPLTFAFPSLEEQGAQVVVLSHPVGERDEMVHATVLRGGGEFTFSR